MSKREMRKREISGAYSLWLCSSGPIVHQFSEHMLSALFLPTHFGTLSLRKRELLEKKMAHFVRILISREKI